MPEQIIFPVDVEVGKYYKVPCVKAKAIYPFMDWNYIPINSHLHEDVKVIGFKHRHWHIDWRFANRELFNDRVKGARDESSKEVASVISLMETHELDENFMVTDSEEIFYRRLKCKRRYQAGDFFSGSFYQMQKSKNSWPIQLSKKFCSAKLKEINGQFICPHKGVVIDKNCKDHDGNYVCPGHLLRFNPKTLQVVPN